MREKRSLLHKGNMCILPSMGLTKRTGVCINGGVMTGEEVRALRDFLGMTQEEMGETLGVAELTIRRWEKGYFKPSPLALEKLHQLRDSLLEKVG